MGFGVEVEESRLSALCARYGVASLMVFGSVAREVAGPDSDVDVLYELVPGRRLGWEVEDLADELAELFGRRVDLVAKSALHPRLRAAVLAQARALYSA